MNQSTVPETLRNETPNILIVGAASAIAEATARLWAARGAGLFLVGRDGERLGEIAADLRIRGARRVETFVMDATAFDQHERMQEAALSALGSLEIALIAHGSLSDQKACESSVEETLREIQVNALSVIALATRLAGGFEARGGGCLAVIGSVAGDRGRGSNYVYGSAKAFVAHFLSGLRNRLDRKGVHVLTIKPGFVDTPMTAALKKGMLWAKPEAIARGIVRAIERRQDEVYLPSFWRLIMFVVRHIPERIFKRMSL
ncbi:MAG: SDR family oxidoreductase [Betaproteobacteria bacterium]|nr:SDR family oxidoreductase [Betaproteobacteria bacterium]